MVCKQYRVDTDIVEAFMEVCTYANVRQIKTISDVQMYPEVHVIRRSQRPSHYHTILILPFLFPSVFLSFFIFLSFFFFLVILFLFFFVFLPFFLFFFELIFCLSFIDDPYYSYSDPVHLSISRSPYYTVWVYPLSVPVVINS